MLFARSCTTVRSTRFSSSTWALDVRVERER